jgi:lysyl-tRNA synthetase class 2
MKAGMEAQLLRERSRLVSATRAFFLDRDYLETDTPILCPAPIPESCLEVFPTSFVNPFLGSMDLWLLPSPEIWMKRLIAEHRASVFQICKCFRNAESIGRIHNPEFTMLEYYTMGADATASIGLTEELFRTCSGSDTPAACLPPFRIMTMAEAFVEFAGIDLEAHDDSASLSEAARSRGLLVAAAATWEDVYNQTFVNWVEPALPQDRPLVLSHYPARVECLAADIPGTPWKDRWELYAQGIELANCYTECADAAAVRRSMLTESTRKAGQLVPHRVDLDYANIFMDFPACSGVAMGFDRFVMTMTGRTDIRDVLLFPFEDIFSSWGTKRRRSGPV